jgi:S1-C subfamily serine protease
LRHNPQNRIESYHQLRSTIAQVGGKDVGNVSDLLSAVAGLKPGEAARFTLQRRDDSLNLDVTPGVRPRPNRAPAR